jgi:hypothetical protein
MKKRFLLSSAAISVFSGLLIHFAFNDSNVQAQQRQAIQPKSPTVASIAKVDTVGSAFINAASENDPVQSLDHPLTVR